MAQFAPNQPSTAELHASYMLSPDARERIDTTRQRVSEILGGRSTGLLVVIGPCSMSDDIDIALNEGSRLAALTDTNQSIQALHRIPFWKPRSRDEDWHGLETTDPVTAFATMSQLAENNANVTAEIGHIPHLDRYGHLLSMGWKGGRTFDSKYEDNDELVSKMAVHDPNLPIAIKNAMSGSIAEALVEVDHITNTRSGQLGHSALLFRGGQNVAPDPSRWEDAYLAAHNASDGRLIVDVAHGGEQAHDPNRMFGKSQLGQIACLAHLIQIVEATGKAPSGLFVEASDATSRTDPVIPFTTALQLAEDLADTIVLSRARDAERSLHN